jgi:small-conductance mechanosensitive channel
MLEYFYAQDWMTWAIAIVIGFPLLAAVLGQILAWSEKRELSFANSLWFALNFLLPLTAFYLIFRFVVGAPPENTANRLLLTLALVLLIYVTVSVFNAGFFGAAPSESWRARTPKLLRDIILGIMVIVGGGIVASQVWDQNVAGIFTALGVGSVILGFALQETLGNIMLGLSLLLERPFSEGDWVTIGDVEGEVVEINWRAVRIRTRAGDTVVIPHGIAAKERLTNNTVPETTEWIHEIVGFDYESPPGEVKETLLEVLSSTPGVMQNPAPKVHVASYGDSAINYKIIFAVSHPREKLTVQDEVLTRIWYAAKRANINVPFPIRTIYNFDGAAVAKEHAEMARSRLSQVPLFKVRFNEGQLADIEKKSTKIAFAPGEYVVRQGQLSPAFFIIDRGSVELRSNVHDGKSVTLYELGKGDFFGEDTLLSDSDARYNIVATSNLSVISIDIEYLQDFVERYPATVRDITQVMETRRKAIHNAMH